MERVSIRFERGGKCEIRDEKGKLLAVDRAVIYVATGNAYPVAVVHLEGQAQEVPVDALDVEGAGTLTASADVMDDVEKERKKK